MTAAKLVRIGFRLAVLIGVCVVGFYIGRPVYWKLSATLQEIREKDYTQEAVKQGFSDLVAEAQRSVGWGPGATISFEQERALKKAQLKKEIEMAKPKLKTSKDNKSDSLLVSELTKEAAVVTDEKSKDELELSKKATSTETTAPKSVRRRLLL